MSSKTRTGVRELLSSGLGRYEQMLHRANLDAVVQGMSLWRRERDREIRQRAKQVPRHARSRWLEEVQSRFSDPRDPASTDARDLFDFLCLSVERELKLLEDLKRCNADFRRSLAHVSSQQEHRRLILNYASDLGATRSRLRGDHRAFRRWFDEEAISDRFLRRVGEAEYRLVFFLQRLGTVAARVVSHTQDRASLQKTWNRLGIERLLHATLDYEGDVRVHVAALQCLVRALKASPETASALVTEKTVAVVDSLAQNRSADVWLQSEAIGILEMVCPTAEKVIEQRLSKHEPGDDLFVRRRAVRILGDRLADWPTQIDLFPRIAADESDFVRQQFARIVWQAPVDVARQWIDRLARQDGTPQVRAAVLLESLARLQRAELHHAFLRILTGVLASEQDSYVCRVAMQVATQWLENFIQLHPVPMGDQASSEDAQVARHRQQIVDWYARHLLPALRRRQSEAKSIPLRRWAADAAERISCLLDPNANQLLQRLRTRLEGLGAGKSRIISRRSLNGLDDDTLGRLFAVLAQDDFGFDVQRSIWGYRVTRGPVYGFRLWRFLFEIFHPATDKRQAVKHTVGRISYATLRAPSAIMGELSETKVPGEPVLMAAEGTWRPYLPLPDDFVSVLNLSWLFPRTVKFYTSQGVTEVAGPRSVLTRWRANYCLTTRFAEYARLRNWDHKAGTRPEAYMEAMQNIGFEVRFRAYDDERGPAGATDASVSRFFPCLLAVIDFRMLSSLKQYFHDYASYFTSAFENSLTHLCIFATALFCLFLARHSYANWALRKARKRIALSIGGWGTRGKSGTERLKAALLAALGHSVVSKSTGCEAMFLHSRRYGDLLEIPLFRPYDKATIWEQRHILQIAAGLDSSVFLWECMGLTPAYVEVLQRQWTRDDISTITNTYPDHEDLQGPAGYNVAQTISVFVPRRAHLLTTEQQMRPILADACTRAGTSLRGIGWVESGLITDDLLDRFPYKEHPDNIALVLAMSDELDCDHDFALKAMADNMVPDLGVLKTYPPADVRTRTLEFTNGMSANERFGCLGNWQRLGFDQQNLDTEPDTWISTVVNNRADRVARSRVFASILVNDISADRHFLIGGNLKGLQGFIGEAWADYVRGISLWSDDGSDTSTAQDQFNQLAVRFRQPTDVKHIQSALAVMLDAVAEQLPDGVSDFEPTQFLDCWSEPDRLTAALKSAGLDDALTRAVHTQSERLQTAWQEYTDFSQRIAVVDESQRAELDERLRKLLRTWFDRKLVVVEDYDAAGEQIIHTICEETPPGYRNRIMGLQNIKGTGLDFVYRWQAWDACYSACKLLVCDDAPTAEHGLQALCSTPVYGQLCDQHLRLTVEQVRRSPVAKREEFQLQLEAILEKLDRSLATLPKGSPTSTPRRRRILDWVLNFVEDFMDVNDAVRRRKKADRIYRDLQAERIGRHRAVAELRALNKRQKGGWLAPTG